MQKIILTKSFEQDWIRMFTHLANLFFEQSKISTDPEEDGILVDISINREGATITGFAHVMHNGNEYSAIFSEQVTTDESETETRQLKRIYSHVFLEVLEQLTGMKQSWGILTGIRPMKLFHKYRQLGNSVDEAKRLLMEKHRISEEKSELLASIERVQLKAIPDLHQIQNDVSIYIGIPFCPTKCAYCTFPAYAIHRKNGRVENFLDGLHVEIREIGKWLTERDIKITTIYFGGGTPTSIEAEEMDALYQTMYDSFPHMKEVREVTVEAGRPDTITPAKIDVLKKWGIDRISVNPQSYTDETLKAIGRHHSVQETIDKFWLSRNMGMKNINMDLIIGLPNEGLEEFRHSLDETEKMQPESLTVHTLSFKRASEMTRNKDKYKVADRETVEQMMQMGEQWTKENGYASLLLVSPKKHPWQLGECRLCEAR